MFNLIYKQTKPTAEKIKTEISIRQELPYTQITVLVDGDQTHKSDVELIDLALHEFYKLNFATKYQNESIEELKTEIEKAKKTTSEVIKLKKIVFAGDLTEPQKTELLNQYDKYAVGVVYKIGDVFDFNKMLYEVLQEHTSQEDWKPDKTLSLYKLFLVGGTVDGGATEVINDFVQPTGAHDSYMIGDKVLFEGKVYESLIDGNSYSPTTYPAGWEGVV